MPATYRHASAVERLAREIIAEHRDDLADVHIEYVFRSETADQGGKEVWGKARKVTGLNAYLAGDTAEGEEVDDFFVIEIAEPVWAVIEPEQRKALVDHELAHCTVTVNGNGETKLAIRPHDVEEFASIVRRYGLWRDDVEQFLRAAADSGQLSILDDIAP